MKGIQKESDNFSDAAGKGFLVKDKNGNVALSEWWKGKGGLVDFTNPDAVEWWNKQMERMLTYGVKAFKCDDGEGNFVPDAVFYDGTPAYEMKNRYSLLYDSVMQTFVNKYLDGDGVLITRSGYTGFQKYPFAWAGDNNADFSLDNGLPSVIIAGQNAALSGISLWGTDIAGYAGTPTKELFIRWTQFAVFCPFMQIHMTSNLGPWDFDEETLEIFRKYAVLRVQLFPYLYNAVHEAVNTGVPVIRPMALAFQDDREARKNTYQFMFGDDILVAPIYQQANHRTVYLPAGEWIDYWSGEKINGKKYIEVEALLDKIPLYVRAGSIIPLLLDDIQTLVYKNPKMADTIKSLDDRRILQVWTGANETLKTWDGITANLSKQNDLMQLNFSSEIQRPLSIEIMFRKLNDLKINNAEIRYDEVNNKTIISFQDFKGSNSLKWNEQ
jgi:alpha-D-xyloside xylohydrolase